MKVQKLLGTAFLSTILLGGMALNATPASADSTVKGTGSVTVDEGSIDPGEDGKDPETPTDPTDPIDPTNPDNPIIPGEKGSLTILGVSKLQFGTIKTSSSVINQPAAATTVKKSGVAKTVGNFIQYGDIRTTNNGYILTAKMTKQFTSDNNKTLANASVSYKNAIMTHEEGTKLAVKPVIKNKAMELVADAGTAVEVVNLEKATTGGKGIYSIEYGQTSNYDENFTVDGTPVKGSEAESVYLNIPSSTASTMAVGNYTAEITWSLTAAQP